MNEYSRELMHMTTSEKADYNRRYYQRNKQYWKDYYKTGHGIGRKPGALSGSQAIKWDWENEKSSSVSPVRKTKTYTNDGRVRYDYDRDNARHWRETRNNGKTLDNERHDDRVLEYTDKFVTARKQHNYKDAAMYRKLIDMNEGDTETDRATRDAARNGANRPRTVNVPTKTVDRAKAAVKRLFLEGIPYTVNRITESGVKSAKSFLKKLGIS